MSRIGSAFGYEFNITFGDSNQVPVLLEIWAKIASISWHEIVLNGTNPNCIGTYTFDNDVVIPSVPVSKYLVAVSVDGVEQIGLCELRLGAEPYQIEIQFYPSVDKTINWPNAVSKIYSSTVTYPVCWCV
jgi:hypothetical protein